MATAAARHWLTPIRAAATAPQTRAAMGIAALRAAALAARQDIPAKTTIAVKRAADQVASAVMTASASSMTVIKSGAHVANPWLRAIVLSPSVKHFLTTVALGDRDFRSLASLMVKPRNAVKMTLLGRSQSRPVAGSFQRRGDRLRADGELRDGDPYGVAAVAFRTAHSCASGNPPFTAFANLGPRFTGPALLLGRAGGLR